MRHGFSLVELSIVLVILGLLTGGILAGQSLIRAAELRAVSTEYQRYLTAIGSFRDKYFSLAGDMTNATSVWPVSAGCPTTTSVPATGVCNGNGNGMIDMAATSRESYGFWEHLAYAGLIEGTYTGGPNSTTATDDWARLGVDLPKSKLGNNAGWTMGYIGSIKAWESVIAFEGDYGNALAFGGSAGAYLDQPVLRPEEAWNIDSKLDDGMPAVGVIRTAESQGGTCSDLAPSSSSLTASKYLLSNATLACTFIFKSGY